MTGALPVLAPKELQKSLDDYYANIEHRLEQAEANNVTLSIANGSLTAEVGMLREELARADADRIRLQAVASTLSGELMSIKDVIEGSVRRALEAGVNAKPVTKQPEKPVQADPVVELERLARDPEPLPVPAQAATKAIPAPVDWGTKQ